MNFVDIGKSVPLKSCTIHSHDLWEIELNLEGEGVNCIKGANIEFKKSTIVCLPPNYTHGKSSKNGFRDMFIHCKSMNLPVNNDFTVLNDDDGTITSLFNILFEVFKNQTQTSNKICQTLFEAIEQVIISKLSTSESSPKVEKIKSIIIDNYHNPDFSVTKLSETIGYCDDHLRRLFKNETGKTMLEYLTDLRITHAKKLLSENDKLRYTVAEIGTMCGFYDISYFSRVFKKKTGSAPSEFK